MASLFQGLPLCHGDWWGKNVFSTDKVQKDLELSIFTGIRERDNGEIMECEVTAYQALVLSQL